jgi:hypothetical protein
MHNGDGMEQPVAWSCIALLVEHINKTLTFILEYFCKNTFEMAKAA